MGAPAGEGERALAGTSSGCRAGRDSIPSPAPRWPPGWWRWGPNATGWCWRVSGLCADGASLDVIVAQLGDLYQAARDQRGPPDAEPVQYVDFAGWQESLREEDGAAEAESFWKAQMAAARTGSPATTAAGGGSRPTRRAGRLDAALVERLGDGAADI